MNYLKEEINMIKRHTAPTTAIMIMHNLDLNKNKNMLIDVLGARLLISYAFDF